MSEPDPLPASGNRMLPIRREELSELGQRLFDETLNDTRLIAGLAGPAGIQLRAPRLAELAGPVFQYLRDNAILDRRLSELAILASAREIDQHFEWHAHERVALNVGLEPEIIDVIRWRRPIDGLADEERILISIAREAIGEHTVRSESFVEALRLFGAEALVLYISLMGQYAAVGYLLHVFGQELPDGETSKLPARP